MLSEINPIPAQESMGPVPVTNGKVGGVKCLVVNARELHSAIGSERKFADWAKYKIAKFGFKEGVDFEVLKVSLMLQNQIRCRALQCTAQRRIWCPARSGAWTRQGDVPFDAGGGGAVRRSIHEVAGVSQKRNALDTAHLKSGSQSLARMDCGPSKGKWMR